MTPVVCIYATLSLWPLVITHTQGSVITKRQTTPCPPNCFHCDGGSCSSCNSGWYGEDCSRSCSGCPGGCIKDTGVCLCPPGTFGPTCSENCPANCQSDNNGRITCNQESGHCDSGCKSGYHGQQCNLTCGNCRAVICNQTTGHCNKGCSDGWGEPFCNVTCIPNCRRCSVTDLTECSQCSEGYYGLTCSDTLSSKYTTPLLSTSTVDTPHSQVRGLSKATIDIIVGIAFGFMLLILLVFVVLYTNREKLFRKSRRKKGQDLARDTELLYIQDMETGSLKSVDALKP